jgi:hypothetical protein
MEHLLYPIHMCLVTLACLIPVLRSEYYPLHVYDLNTRRAANRVNSAVIKNYYAYTQRLLVRICDVGINKVALRVINQHQLSFQEKICKTAIRLMLDNKIVTIRERHLRVVASVLVVEPTILTINDRLDKVRDVGQKNPGRSLLDEHSGLLFPPSRFRTYMNQADSKWRVSTASAVASAILVQVFTEMILLEAARLCRLNKKRRIIPEYIHLAMLSPAVNCVKYCK